MIRYSYEFAFDFRPRSCNTCLNYGSCKNTTRKVLTTFGECMNSKHEYKHPDITASNVDWHLHLITKDMWIAKTNADTIIRNHRMDWAMPESLKDKELQNGPSVIECLLYKEVLGEILKFISSRKKEYDLIKRDTSGAKIVLANAIIDTKVLIDGNAIKLNIDCQELYDILKNKFKNIVFT